MGLASSKSKKLPKSDLSTLPPASTVSELNIPHWHNRYVERHFPKSISYTPTSKKQKNFKCRHAGCGKINKSAVARITHERSHGVRPLPPGARLVTNPVIHGRLNKTESLKFIELVNKLPIYFIKGHSCICVDGSDCFGERVPPTFNLTKDTYIINMGQPGDGVKPVTDRYVYQHVEDFRRLLYLHGPDDFAPSSEVGQGRFSLFAGFQRAVGPHDYPNITYTFNDTDEAGRALPRSENPYGVYDLSRPLHPTNDNSLIPQDAARQNWTMHDIIQDVYRVTGRRQGIFISAGCLTTCKHDETDEAYESEKVSLRNAGMLTHTAESAYKGMKPVLTAGELITLGMSRPPEPVTPFAASTHVLKEENADLYVSGLANTMPEHFMKHGGAKTRRRK